MSERCVRCGKCNPVCPTYRVCGNELFSPRGRYLLGEELLSDRISATPDVVKPFLSCTDCYLCNLVCPVGLDIVEVVHKVREKFFVRNESRSRFSLSDFGIDYKGEVYKGKMSRGNGSVLLFPGCLVVDNFGDTLERLTELLAHLDIPFAIVDACCNYHDWFRGGKIRSPVKERTGFYVVCSSAYISLRKVAGIKYFLSFFENIFPVRLPANAVFLQEEASRSLGLVVVDRQIPSPGDLLSVFQQDSGMVRLIFERVIRDAGRDTLVFESFHNLAVFRSLFPDVRSYHIIDFIHREVMEG
ncbi:(Fe-S)-binding protein [bacterium]|nr:(Fe-S)-binding protein [bacterium]